MKRNCNAPWQRKGIAGKERGGGKQRYRSERIHASFFFPPHPLLRGHRPPHPKPLIYAPFGQFYSLLVFLQIGKPLSPLYTPCIPTPCPFPLSFLSFILSPLHPTSVPSPSLLLLAFRASSDCLLFAYLRVAIRPHFLSFIIALLFFFTVASMLEEEGKIVTLWLNEVLERCWNFVLALHGRTDLLWISYERISSNSRARSESENTLLKKLIIDHPSNEQIVRSDSTVVVTSYSDTSSEYTEFDASRPCNSTGSYYATRTNATSPIRCRVSLHVHLPDAPLRLGWIRKIRQASSFPFFFYDRNFWPNPNYFTVAPPETAFFCF